MCKKLKGDDLDFFKSKIESLEFSKQSLETNVQTGIITPDKYIKGVKVYKKQVESLLNEATQKLGADNENTQRLKKRVQLLT
jgi:hypothetical protein